jgi:hypothetical protein
MANGEGVRVARFFFAEHTKTKKYIPKNHKINRRFYKVHTPTGRFFESQVSELQITENQIVDPTSDRIYIFR